MVHINLLRTYDFCTFMKDHPKAEELQSIFNMWEEQKDESKMSTDSSTDFSEFTHISVSIPSILSNASKKK